MKKNEVYPEGEQTVLVLNSTDGPETDTQKTSAEKDTEFNAHEEKENRIHKEEGSKVDIKNERKCNRELVWKVLLFGCVSFGLQFLIYILHSIQVHEVSSP